MTVKEQVLLVIQRLPNDADFRDVTEEIAMLEAIQEAEEDIQQDRLVSNEDMQQRIIKWTES